MDRILHFCTDIRLGSFVLNAPPYIIDEIRTYAAPQRQVQRFPSGPRDGSVIVGQRYAEKIIEVRGRIVAGTRSKQTLERNIDRLQQYLSVPGQSLYPGYEDGRYYNTTQLLDQVEVQWAEDAARLIGWSARLLAADPFAYAPAGEAPLVNNSASSTVSGNTRRKILTPTIKGNIYTWPVITLTLAGGPFGTTSIWVVNASLSPSPTLTVVRTYSASDSLVIDCANQTVKVNGTNVDFTGQFPSFDPRYGVTNSIEIWSTSTSVPTFNTSLAWTKRWLN